jgi:uncharacterized membrane protein YkvA (DUF1232 family)
MRKGGFFMSNYGLKDLTKTTVKEFLLFIPNLLKLLYRLVNDKSVTTLDRTLLLATAAYVISPWDFLPDMIPFLGQLDDLVLLALVFKRLTDSVSSEVLYSYWDGKPDLLYLLEDIVRLGLQFLPPGIYQRLVKHSEQPYRADLEYGSE